jgi:hypothetical protein
MLRFLSKCWNDVDYLNTITYILMGLTLGLIMVS